MGQCFTGRTTPRQFVALTSITDPRPFLGRIINSGEGPFIYLESHLAKDITEMARYWSVHTGRCHVPQPLPDSTDVVSRDMDHVMQCLEDNPLIMNQDMKIGHLSEVAPAKLEMLLEAQTQ